MLWQKKKKLVSEGSTEQRARVAWPSLAFGGWAGGQAPRYQKPGWHRPHEPRGALTYSELLPEDSLLTEGRAVPAAEAELVLALVDAHLRPLPDHDDGIGPALADGTLPRGQTGDLVADDVGSQGHDRRQRSAKGDKTPRGELAGRGPLPLASQAVSMFQASTAREQNLPSRGHFPVTHTGNPSLKTRTHLSPLNLEVARTMGLQDTKPQVPQIKCHLGNCKSHECKDHGSARL